MQPDADIITHVDPARKESPFLATKQAAQYVGLSPRTLEKMRTEGGGPSYRKHGRYVRYHLADLDAWSISRLKNSTSEENASAPPPRREHPVQEKTRRISGTPDGINRRHA